MAEPDLTLTANLRSATLDARRGIVRLHPTVLTALGLHPGDPVRLTGRRTTAGIVARAEPASGRDLLHADDLLLGNLGVRAGDPVTVAPVPVLAAHRVVLTGPPEVAAVVPVELLRLALLGKLVTVGDDVSLLPRDVLPDDGVRALVDAARRSLANTMGYAWTSTLLTVTAAEPASAALVTMDTVVGWSGGPATNGMPQPTGTDAPAGAVDPGRERSGYRSAVPARSTAPSHLPLVEPEPAPTLADLPGVRAQAQALTELLDLGFHHGEVLGRLGTTISLGVLITGAAGSGKSALVRAVAGTVGARIETLWAPELAALTNDAAARRLDALTTSVRGHGPAVLLVTDVEALAPRDEPGPLATVFRQLLGDTIRAGAAVVCTTSRPEAVDPSLRAPDLLSLELAVPLPDTALRREQLAVLTRKMPLAEDVRLDEVAARTPGFVAADLAALAREAGVRAALRQRTDESPVVAMVDFTAALEVVRPTSMSSSTLRLATVTLDDVGDMAQVKETLTESVLWPLTYPDTFARLGVQPPRGCCSTGRPAAARRSWSPRSPARGGRTCSRSRAPNCSPSGSARANVPYANCSAGPATPPRP